jgi:putative ABC transport system ATP-binding protein
MSFIGNSPFKSILSGGELNKNNVIEAPHDNSSILVTRGLSRNFHRGLSEVNALNSVSIEIPAGGFVALSGPSGSGKSSLLNILGLIDKPDQGEVYLQGKLIDYEDTADLERQRREKLGFIFQDFNLIPVLSALENVEMPLLARDIKANERKELAAAALDAVGLADRLHHCPHQMSGGQQQRVAVARALVTEPALVLADEPTANLDSRTTFELLDLMSDISVSRGTTFVFSTHDQRVLEKANQVIYLLDGKVVK